MHFIIAAGGWSAQKKSWIEHKRNEKFLYPVRAMSVVFQGKFIAGLKRLYRDGKFLFPGDLQSFEDEDSAVSYRGRIFTFDFSKVVMVMN